MELAPHYLRFARGLALAGGLGVAMAACASVVTPDDGGVVDVRVPSDAPSSADAPTVPPDDGTPVACNAADTSQIANRPCATEGEMCGMPGCGTAVCRPGSTPGTPLLWRLQLCGGPLAPPELA